MRGRCERPEDKDFAKYGGRGIQVCAEWSESFIAFYRDMGPRPAGTSIERIDNEGHYCKENCRWATPTEQTRNRRNALNVEIEGETKPLTEWCKQTGVNYFTAHRKLRREGKTPKQVFGGLL